MSLADYAQQVVDAALPQQRQPYGPWHGSMRSVAATIVPPEFIAESDSDAASSNFLYLPRSGTWKRRGGTTQQFDTFASPAGMLPAKWSSKCRDLQEFPGIDISDGVPTVCALLTKETVATGLDDGRFSNFWIRDQVNGLNYTVGSEFETTTMYPPPGTIQYYRFVPLWHDSGDGGITRGVNEFSRRLFFNGSRKAAKVGNWWYFPSVLGTPSRWRGQFTALVGQSSLPSTAGSGGPGDWSNVGGASFLASLTDSSDSTYAHWAGGLGSASALQGDFNNLIVGLTDPGIDTGFKLRMTMRSTAIATGATMQVTIKSGGTFIAQDDSKNYFDVGFSGNTFSPTETLFPVDGSASHVNVTTGFIAYDINITAAEAAGFDFTQQWTWSISFSGVVTADKESDFSRIAIITPGGTATANRLIPSGPLPPTHAGTLAKGNAIAGTASSSFARPDADTTDGTWINQASSNVDLYASIDEATADDTDFIRTPAGSNSVCEVSLADLGFTPASTDTVTIRWRAKRFILGAMGIDLTVQLMEGVNVRGGAELTLSSGYANYSYTLTMTEIGLVTNWTNLGLRFTASGAGGQDTVFVSQGYLEHNPVATSFGGWHGSDRFFYSVAYRFEDDSIWMPCTPRFPNTALTAGYNLFTVDSTNPTQGYDKVIWSNIPIGPFGVKGRMLLRTPKIDSTTTDNLALDPFDLRVVWEIQDNTTTTYDMYFADDDSLVLDVDNLIVRYDHQMPYRARYLFGGDSRVCHSYGGLNPCAIELAPIGRAADYDLNSTDATATLYNQNSSYMRIENVSDANTQLVLGESDGTTNTMTTFVFAAGTTLEALVDSINATSFAVNGRQWRAQVVPGANPQALAATHLTPHYRELTSCTVAAQTITRASLLSKVAVGDLIFGTGVTEGAYVSVINSDLSVTFVGTITAGTKTLTFYKGLGDTPVTAGGFVASNIGWQRVIANSLPGFNYFNGTYLDQFPIEKNAVWMTVASPGAVKSAANCFSNEIANKHTPPHDIGISMGGVGVDNGFLVPFSQGIGAIRNTRDSGTGFDFDYRFFFIEPSQGCCSWASIAAGNRVGVYAKPSGIYAADLFNERLLSEAIWQHPPSEAVLGTGDFTVEMPLSIGSTSADTDNAYLAAKIMRGALWLTFRKSSTTHPDRQVVYDFSSDSDQSGLEAMLRPDGRPYGWSVPLVRSMTMMTEGRRGGTTVGTAGTHLYGWNEANAGSTGDGRIDEFEISETDNGTAISGSITTPWYRVGSNQLSAQEITVEHSSTSGVTAALDFHRSYSDETYSITPSISATLPVIRDVKMLTLPARVTTAACYIGWRQSAGAAAELRAIELRYKSLPSYK